MLAFSKRHRQALSEGRLKPEVSDVLRGRIGRLLEKHNESYTETMSNGWNYDTDVLADLTTALCDLYGTNALPGGANGIKSYLERAPAERVFDAVELFEAPEENAFRARLNQLLAEEGANWRMLDGEMILLDESFARDELAIRADGSLQQAGFSGASAEIRRARNRLMDGDGRGAIHQAGTAFESVAMAILGRDHGKAAKLLQDLNRSGSFDGLPTKLRERFVREVLEAMPWMRNHLGGHGQGENEVEIPLPYAQLAIDMAAAFSHFLIQLKLDQEGVEIQVPEDTADPPGTPQSAFAASDVADFSDFSTTAGGEDDIPF